MISFESDYNNGMLPEILTALAETNNEKTSGYGFDPYTEQAKEKIRKAVGNDKADVFFLVGGTQTNATVRFDFPDQSSMYQYFKRYAESC